MADVDVAVLLGAGTRVTTLAGVEEALGLRLMVLLRMRVGVDVVLAHNSIQEICSRAHL